MQNITQYSNQELSLLFLNNEYLYSVARAATSFDQIKELAAELFEYNQDQLEELENDFNDGAFEE